MKLYIDNNILVSIEDGIYSLDKFYAFLPKDDYKLFYSSAHVFELESFKGNEKISKEQFLTRRFTTIRKLFNDNYLYADYKSSNIIEYNEDPENAYETITAVPFGITAMKGFVNLFSEQQKEEFRNEIGIDMLRINNYTASEIINHLNTKLLLLGSQSFLDIIEHSIQTHPENKNFGIDNRIAAVFDLLDMFGYWKDKQTDTSNYARLWDAQHAYFASHCDYYISDDKRTRNKTRVVYELYKFNTKIISSNNEP